MFAFEGSGERQGRLGEVQREDAHVSVEAILGDLQGPAAGTRHQLLLLQDQDVVGLLAGLEGGGGQRSRGQRVCYKQLIFMQTLLWDHL